MLAENQPVPASNGDARRDEVVISVHNVSKAYRIWQTPAARLTSPLQESLAGFLPAGAGDALRRRAARQYRDFYALRDVSFELKRGESVGIIGRNGSGKSTLLQIIAGTLQPSTGTARSNGRVAALLELGSGFNPEFTGRENVHLNGAVLGLSRAEIDAKFDDIAAFADIGDFIEQPVKTYSSGMMIRLAFAVAVHVDPAILIVDEALSVGDARFQLKCARAIDRFIDRGVTLLFVSHDASMVKRLCNRALLLERGRVLYSGVPNDVVNLYTKLMADDGSVEALAPDIAALKSASPPKPRPAGPASTEPATPPPPGRGYDHESLRLRLKAMETVWLSHPDHSALAQRMENLLDDERLHVQAHGEEFAYGGELGRIIDIEIVDSDSHRRTWYSTGETVEVRMRVESQEDFPEPIFGLTIKNTAGVEIYGTNTLFSRQPVPAMSAGGRREVSFTFNLNLMPGHYFLSFGFTHFVGEELVVVHRRYDAIRIEVHGTDKTFGIANLQAKIGSRELPPDPAP